MAKDEPIQAVFQVIDSLIENMDDKDVKSLYENIKDEIESRIEEIEEETEEESEND